jgi:hypothetical protein
MIKVVAAVGTDNLKPPSESVLVPPVNPLGRTVALTTGAPELTLTTVPDTVLKSWAIAAEKKKIQQIEQRNGSRWLLPDNLLKLLIIAVFI